MTQIPKKIRDAAQPEATPSRPVAGGQDNRGAAFSVGRQIETIGRAVAAWSEEAREESVSSRTSSTAKAPKFFLGKIKSSVLLRSALALAAVLAFGVRPAQRLLATTSAEATVNAQLITIRAPIDGEVAALAHPLEIGEEFQSGEEIAAIRNLRADRAPLNRLQREEAQLIASIHAYEDKMRVLQTRQAQIEAQKAHFAEARTRQVEHRMAEIDAQIAAARAENDSATAAFNRAKILFDKQILTLVDVEKAVRNQRVAAETLKGLLSRSQGAVVELSALRQGVFVGDSYNDTPQSAQRGVDLELEVAELNAKLEGMRSELSSVSVEMESERQRYNDVSTALLRSPAVGRVWEVLTSPGETVRAGQELMRLLDCRAAIVTASVGEATYQKLRLGQKAGFQPRDGGEPLEGWIVGLNGRAAISSNNAIQQSVLAKEPYHVSLKFPDLARSTDCLLGRSGLVTFEFDFGGLPATGLRPGS